MRPDIQKNFQNIYETNCAQFEGELMLLALT